MKHGWIINQLNDNRNLKVMDTHLCISIHNNERTDRLAEKLLKKILLHLKKTIWLT